MSDYNIFLLGSFFPIIAIIITIVFGIFFSGSKRWLVLFFLPISVLLIEFLFADQIFYGGNLLATVIFGIYMMGLFIYYPILIIMAITVSVKNRRKTNIPNIPIPPPPIK